MIKKTLTLLLSLVLIMQCSLPVSAGGESPSVQADIETQTEVTEPEAAQGEPEDLEDEPVPEALPNEAEGKSDENEKTETEPLKLEYKDENFTVTAEGPLPDNTELKARKLDEEETSEYIQSAEKDLDSVVSALQLVDITFTVDGEEIEPEGQINVSITCHDSIPVEDEEAVCLLHFTEKETEVMEADTKVEDSQLKEVSFASDSFSVYAIVEIEPPAVPHGDTLGLGGKSYGIVTYSSGTNGAGMLDTAKNASHIAAMSLLIRENPANRSQILLDGQGSSIAMWNFESVGGSKYKLFTTVSGTTKYISITSSGTVLVTDPAQATEITVTPGTGSNSGKFRLTNDAGRAISLTSGNVNNGYGSSTGSSQNEWHYLVSLSAIQEENYVTYTAKKVSVSDTANVCDGAEVIVYTRVWNPTTKEYEYYGIDHDGSLFRVYVSGDTIQWVGVEFNTALWEFTEYTYDNGRPNYYYELQNLYSEKYLAPQIGQSVLSDSPIGINLNGRRYGDYYSKILAWDNPHYDYAGLKIEDGQLVSDAMANAGDFYFAVIEKQKDELTPVATIDHEPYGITMKLQDYENAPTSGSNRSREMDNLLGNTPYVQWVGTKNLLSRTLGPDGYPIATHSNRSLYELYDETIDVNHHFLLNNHEESGYFVYDSTQNFAHIITDTSDRWYGKARPGGGTYDVGDFVIYKQLGTSNETNKETLKHGQYLPYNDLTEGQFSHYINEKDIHANNLSPYDPRKGERLYGIPYKRSNTSPDYVNHFFGMEMTASFMQSADGLDAWNHDLIFEFSGDDDFWLYVDGILVLDLGGIHSALDGKINFRTGTVNENGTTKTLRELYEQGYRSAHPSATNAEVTEWLDGIFKDGGTVFKDYTGHTMRMFYMERGAGASNLHMKFNLTTVREGDVTLSKEITGTDKADFSSVKFPYQIYYRDPGETEYHRLTQRTITDGSQTFWAVTYKDRNTRIDYDTHAVINGVPYDDVFYLSPGEEAEIHLLSDEREYYIKEVGIDESFYDEVSANGTVLTGDVVSGDIKDFGIPESTVAQRKKVIYTNHVQVDKLKTLTVTKHLYREDYNNSRADAHELHYPEDATQTDPREYDSQTFTYRLYLGRTAPEEGDNLTDYYYRFGKYYVKDPQGNYCIYNNGFQSLGKTNFDDLTEAEVSRATFRTSMNGMADSIPAGYTVEIRNLLSNTWFMIKEDNIPEGYSLLDNTDDPDDIDGYERSGGSYISGDLPNTGWTRDNNASPHLDVNNRRGWGLEVNKIWTDADFMEYHDPIYVGLYYNGSLVEDTLRQLDKSQYYYFTRLPMGGSLSDYEFREVSVTGGTPQTDEEGTVTNTGDLTFAPITPGSSISVGGKMKGYDASTYDYKVKYDKGEPTGSNGNHRIDTLTNSRPGIRVIKTDWEGDPLAGARFSLKGENGPAGKGTYTSASDGSVAVLYPGSGDAITINETKAPAGYLSTTEDILVELDGSAVTVTGGGEYVQTSGADDEMLATITVKNRPYVLSAVKVDAMNDNAPMEGVRFALYRELKTSKGDYLKDYNPLPGYEELDTDENGIIPKIDNTLPAGTYYLCEITAPAGYNKMNDLKFTVHPSGEVTSTNQLLTTTYDQDGTCNFRITVPNTKGYELDITKIWTNGVANINWPVDSQGNDIPLYFTLKRRIGDVEDTGFSKTLKATSDSLVFTSGADSSIITMISGNAATGFKLSVIGLPAKQGNDAYTYYFEEAPVNGFTTKYYDGSGAESEELLNGYTVKNIQKAILLQKLEDGNDSEKLEDARFELYTDAALTTRAVDIYGAVVGPIVTDGNGYGSLGILPNGTYYLKETDAPKGYEVIAHPIIVTVSDNVTYTEYGDVQKQAEKVGEQYIIKLYDAKIPQILPTGVARVRFTFVVLLAMLFLLFMKRRLSSDKLLKH